MRDFSVSTTMINIFAYLFYRTIWFYRRFGKAYSNDGFGAIVLISACQSCNIFSLIFFYHIAIGENLNVGFKIVFLSIAILILILNTILFEYKHVGYKNYEKIINGESPKMKKARSVLILAYIVLSFIACFYLAGLGYNIFNARPV